MASERLARQTKNRREAKKIEGESSRRRRKIFKRARARRKSIKVIKSRRKLRLLQEKNKIKLFLAENRTKTEQNIKRKNPQKEDPKRKEKGSILPLRKRGQRSQSNRIRRGKGQRKERERSLILP